MTSVRVGGVIQTVVMQCDGTVMSCSGVVVTWCVFAWVSIGDHLVFFWRSCTGSLISSAVLCSVTGNVGTVARLSPRMCVGIVVGAVGRAVVLGVASGVVGARGLSAGPG